MSERINGIKLNLQDLTIEELGNIRAYVEERLSQAQLDLGKIALEFDVRTLALEPEAA